MCHLRRSGSYQLYVKPKSLPSNLAFTVGTDSILLRVLYKPCIAVVITQKQNKDGINKIFHHLEYDISLKKRNRNNLARQTIQ